MLLFCIGFPVSCSHVFLCLDSLPQFSESYLPVVFQNRISLLFDNICILPSHLIIYSLALYWWYIGNNLSVVKKDLSIFLACRVCMIFWCFVRDFFLHLETLGIFPVPGSEISQWYALCRSIFIHCLGVLWALLIWKFVTLGTEEMSSIIFLMLSYLLFSLFFAHFELLLLYIRFLESFLNVLSPFIYFLSFCYIFWAITLTLFSTLPLSFALLPTSF